VGALIHAFRAAVYCIGRGFDIAHFHALGPGVMAIIGRLFTKATIITTVHGRDDKRDKWGLAARTILKLAVHVSARVPHATLVVSQTLADEYLEEFDRKTTVVPNSTHRIDAVEPGPTLERFGVKRHGYFVSVGRLVPEKAPHELVAAHAKTLTDMPLLVVGGAAGTELYVQELERTTDGSSKILFTGPLYGDELAEVLTNAGGFITSSHLEGLPTALIEAGRAGLPVIASDIPPHCEILETEGGDDGRRVYPVGNVEALTSLIDEVAENLSEEMLGAKLFAPKLDERYAPPRTAETHEQAYLATIAVRSG